MKGFTKKQKIKKNLKGISLSYFPSPPPAALFIFIVEKYSIDNCTVIAV